MFLGQHVLVAATFRLRIKGGITAEANTPRYEGGTASSWVFSNDRQSFDNMDGLSTYGELKETSTQSEWELAGGGYPA